MGWEKRGSFRYYYKKLRSRGKVTSSYIGRSPLAEVTAAIEEVNREVRDWERLGAKAFADEIHQTDLALDRLGLHLRSLTEATLRVIVFHKHKGQWRRRQDWSPLDQRSTPASSSQKIQAASSTSKDIMFSSQTHIHKSLQETEPLIQSALQEAKSLTAWIQRVKKEGNLEKNDTLRKLRAILDSHPTQWSFAGDLVREAAHQLIVVVAGRQPQAEEHLLGALEQIREALQRESSPPLEQLLIDQVALCWLHCQIINHIYFALGFGTREINPTHGPYWEKRLAVAERRYQRAVETLARTRKLVRSTKKVQATYMELQASCQIDVPICEPTSPDT